jgi:Phosphotransferase enzyme family
MIANSLESAATLVLSHYHLPRFGCRALGNAGGFSGARLWKVETMRTAFCLKAWPAYKTPAELKQMHAWMASSRQAGLTFVPEVIRASDGTTFRQSAKRIWDLTEWMPGSADFHICPSRDRIAAAGSALAMLHQTWGRASSEVAGCPAVMRRLAALSDGQNLLQSGWQPKFGSADNQLHEPVKRVWPLLPHLIAEQISALLPFCDVAVPVQPCLADIWHDHVLYVNDTVSGIIDYGSMRIDSPATDLARLLGSMVGHDDALFQAGMDAYRSIRGDATPDAAFVRLLDRSGTVGAVVQWLKWLYLDSRPFDDMNVVARRLGQLTARLDSLAWGRS